MPFKGFNSILFDIDSIIDIEISVLRWISIEYLNEGKKLDWINEDVINSWTSIKDLTHMSMYGGKDLFKSIINPDCKNLIDNYYNTMINIWNRDYNQILHEDIAIYTDMVELVRMYYTAGNGTINADIRVDHEDQIDPIMKIISIPRSKFIVGSRDHIDMDNYARLIAGNFRSFSDYTFNQPKSLVVLNFADNFAENNSHLLRPELIIKFSDVHDISVAPAYKSTLKEEM